jgi:N-acetyl sugar amidotransferase
MSDKIVCNRCILTSDTPSIKFNSEGICNYCELYDIMEAEYPLGEINKINLDNLISKIKKYGKNKPYDCVAGVSGGTDSTYMLHLAKKLDLRVLAVHFDNGWDSELAVSNIKSSLEILGYDLYTYVIDWEEFKDLQLSFLKASTIDSEIPTDLAINGVLYKTALKKGINYILSGISFRTEGNMPQFWAYGDGKYVKSVQKLFGTKKLNSFPNLTIPLIFYYTFIKRIKLIRFLNYFDYSKFEAAKILEKELGWRNYAGHHFESIYTRFYQGYISPVKFNVDRRIVSLSAQVRSGHILREDALKKIQEQHYDPYLLKEDKIYIAKKFGISLREFENLLNLPPKTFRDYPNSYSLLKRTQTVLKIASKMKLIPMVFHETKYN